MIRIETHVPDPHRQTSRWPARRSIRRPSAVCAFVVCMAVAACQSGPTTPEPVTGNQTGILPSGRYLLTVGNTSLTSEPDPSCVGPKDAWAPFGPNVAAFVTLSPDADGWIGRMESPADGTAELHLRRSGTGEPPALTGTLRGVMNHALDRFLSNSRRAVSFGTDANGTTTVDGSLFTSDGFFGNASGAITFTPTSGGTLSCAKAVVVMGRGSQ